MAIDWKTLTHAQGPANRVPTRLKQLVGKVEDKRVDAFDTLRDMLVGAGGWFPASAPAVAWLLDAVKKAPEPDLVLTLAAEILGGDHLRAWLAPADEPIADDARPSLEAALERRATILDALASADPRARASATTVVATLPALADEARPRLRELAARDAEAVVRASALLALGRLDAGDAAEIAASQGADHPLVRGAAAVARLRLDAALPFDATSDEIIDWLRWVPPDHGGSEPQLPWFGGLAVAWYKMNQPLDPAPQALAALARARHEVDALIDLCLTIGRREAMGAEARRLGQLVLDLADLGAIGRDEVALFDDLPPRAQATARGLAETTLLPLAGHGLPACGAPRRRWAGIAPRGPLDAEITVDGAPLPLWRAFRELRRRGPVSVMNPLPAPLDEHLRGRDRFQALAELSTQSYAVGCQLPLEVGDAELAALPNDDAIVALAAQIASDLAGRYAAAERDEAPVQPDGDKNAFVLGPLLRAGRPLEPRWDALVVLDREPAARRLLEALPPERREARFRAHFARKLPPFAARQTIEAALPLLDLAPTRATIDAVLAAIEAYRAQPHAQVEPLLEALEARGREHPAVGAALAAARQGPP